MGVDRSILLISANFIFLLSIKRDLLPEIIQSHFVVMIFKSQYSANWFDEVETPFRIRFVRCLTYTIFGSVFVCG